MGDEPFFYPNVTDSPRSRAEKGLKESLPVTNVPSRRPFDPRQPTFKSTLYARGTGVREHLWSLSLVVSASGRLPNRLPVLKLFQHLRKAITRATADNPPLFTALPAFAEFIKIFHRLGNPHNFSVPDHDATRRSQENWTYFCKNQRRVAKYCRAKEKHRMSLQALSNFL